MSRWKKSSTDQSPLIAGVRTSWYVLLCTATVLLYCCSTYWLKCLVVGWVGGLAGGRLVSWVGGWRSFRAWVSAFVPVGGGAVVIVFCTTAVFFSLRCCCSHINSHNQVRGHRTGSSHSGAEEYPREKTQTKPKVVHAYITADVIHASTRNI